MPIHAAVIFKNVKFEYQSKNNKLLIFDNFNIVVEKGEFWLIEGPNGVGKSTFLDIAAKLKQANGGEIIVNCERIQYLQQDYIRSLFPWHDVAWNICLPLLAKEEISHDSIYDKAQSLCDEMGVALRLKDFPFNLSGGQKHLLTLLRAFAVVPDLLLLDEPATGLDPVNLGKFWETLSRFKDQNPELTVICVSHQTPHLLSIDSKHVRMFGPPTTIKPVKKEENLL